MIELSQNQNSVCLFLIISSDFQSTCHSDRTAHFKLDLQECMAMKSFEFTLPPKNALFTIQFFKVLFQCILKQQIMAVIVMNILTLSV